MGWAVLRWTGQYGTMSLLFVEMGRVRSMYLGRSGRTVY